MHDLVSASENRLGAAFGDIEMILQHHMDSKTRSYMHKVGCARVV